MYRHPRSTVDFYQYFEDFLIQIDNPRYDSVLTGDFNIDYSKVNDQSSPACKLNELLSTYGLSQTIKSPTRITDSSSTIIDLTITNTKNYTSGVGVVSVADHLLNFIILDSESTRTNHRFVTSRNFKNLDPKKLVEDLNFVPWHVIECFDNINDIWDTWKLLFDDVVKNHAPLRNSEPLKTKRYLGTVKKLIP